MGWYAPDSYHLGQSVLFLCRQCSGLNARLPRCRDSGEKICYIFLIRNGAKKVTGEGCNRASLCHSFTECPPLHYIYMYAVVSDRVAPGRGRKGPTPGHRFCRKRKKRCRVQRTQHRLNKSERNTIGPTSPFPPLKKGGCLGIIRLRCSRETVVLSGTVTHHRGIAGSQPAIPCRFNCVSRSILYHALKYFKWLSVFWHGISRSFGSSFDSTLTPAESADI